MAHCFGRLFWYLEKGDGSMALWGGRFEAGVAEVTQEFGASLPVDKHLYKQDIAGSKAHAKMLAAQGIISAEDEQAIAKGLTGIEQDIDAGNFTFDINDEDIHMSIESELTRRIGEAGKRLHTGRSRNDQVATDTRLGVKALAKELMGANLELRHVLVDAAKKYDKVILPGYTHMQHAQPVLLSHHLLAYSWMFARDFTRLKAAFDAADNCPLGAAALAGTSYPLDRQMTAAELGFADVIPNSLDAVSDRDFLLDLHYAGSVMAMHLSRLSEEIVLWSSSEFGFITLSDSYSTGSSIMPQKKNPDIAELTRGKSGRLIGDLTGLLATLKGLPTAYARDLQEDKEAVFDQVDTLEVLLPAFTGMVATMVFDKERLEAEAPTGFALATDIAEWLVKNGVPFRHAHELSGACVKIAEDRGQELWDLTDEDFINVFKDFLPADKAPQVREVLSTEGSVSARNGKGGTSPLRVREQIVSAKTTIEQLRAFANSVSDGSAYKSPESLLK